MKKLLSLTAAALLLITTGCGRSNAPPASASSGTPSVSAPITEPTVESSDDTTPTVQKDEAAVKPQSSRRLDDSRIIPLYSERFTYTDPNGIEDTYFYEVPQIDDDTEDAKHINEMINYRYGYLVERAQDARSRNDFIDTGFIIWVSNWNGPVLSLQITSSDRMFNDDVGSYHYNFATGQELTNLDLLEYMGYTDSAKTLNALQRATAQHFDLYYGGDKSEIERNTNETKIKIKLNIDGTGKYLNKTKVGFLDHMLDLFARHGRFDLETICDGDTHIDYHHSVEDTAIVLGKCFAEALGNLKGIKRYGNFFMPMCEALTLVAIDICGRSHLIFESDLINQKIGDFDTELVKEFFTAFTNSMNITMHIKTFHGENTHHIIESIFKGFAKALSQAVEIDEKYKDEILSTKGIL